MKKPKRRGKVLGSRLRKLNRPGEARRLRQPSLYSRTEEVREKRPRNGFWFFLLSIFSIGGLIFLVFFSGVFAVEKVEFSPTKFVDRGELARAVENGKTFLDNNIITFGIFNLASRAEKVTGVEKVSVSRVSQHRVVVVVTEKSPLLVWQSLDKKYLVDSYGYIWSDYRENYASTPVLVDTKNLPVKIGDKVLPQGSIYFFRDLQTQFADTGAKAVRYEIMDIVSDLKVVSDAGWFVYFDTNRSANGELVSLKRVLAEAKNNGTKLEYVDIRIANRIFYK